jgi:hypothetical protein
MKNIISSLGVSGFWGFRVLRKNIKYLLRLSASTIQGSTRTSKENKRIQIGFVGK